MIKKYRKAARMTQEEMSKKFEIPLSTIKKWDSGKSEPPKWAEKLIIEKLEEIIKEGTKMKLYYGNILLKEILTNHSMSVDEALEISGIDMDEYAKEKGWEDWDWEELRMEYND